jgi:hypothetical protein
MSAPIFYTGHTTCSGTAGEHVHTLPAGGYQLTPYVTIHDPRGAVSTAKAPDGRLVRFIGNIVHMPETGQTHVFHREGATAVEVQALVETATDPLLENPPSNWPAHPCHPLRRRTCVYRYVDDDFVEEAAGELFADLQDGEQAMAIASWAESLVTA